VHRISQGAPPACVSARAAAVNTGQCVAVPHSDRLDPFRFLVKHWRGTLQVVVAVGTTIGAGLCVAASDGVCAAFLPQIYAAEGALNYTISAGSHTALGYAKALTEGTFTGFGAAACAVLCAEATALFILTGSAETLLGADAGAFDYVSSPGRHSWAGFAKAAILGAIQNGPYPIEKIISPGQH
jgi:hypothetical protein